MKAPESKTPAPQQATPTVPAFYLAMAAAHMQKLGKQVYQDPNTPQAPVKAPDAPSD